MTWKTTKHFSHDAKIEDIIKPDFETDKKTKKGRPSKFKDATELLNKILAYFKWCDDNPIYDNKIVTSREEGITEKSIAKARPYNVGGCALFCGVSESFFNEKVFEANNVKNPLKDDFMRVIHWMRQTCADQKISGAASGIFNGTIVAMQLGLAQKHEVEEKGQAKQVTVNVIKSKAKKKK